jgi:tetratricopeptide (TPR) repeat protein
MRQKSVLGVLLAVLVIFIFADRQRNRDWKSDFTIWTKTATQQPRSPVAHNNLGAQLQRAGRVPEAVSEFEAAIEIYHGYNINLAGTDGTNRTPSRVTRKMCASAHNNIGLAYVELGKYRHAEREFKTAVAIDSTYSSPCYNLGLLYLNGADNDRAIGMLARAIRINRLDAKAHRALAQAYEGKGMWEAANREYAESKRLMEKLKSGGDRLDFKDRRM